MNFKDFLKKLYLFQGIWDKWSRSKSVFENLPTPLFITDLKGNVTYKNSRCSSHFQNFTHLSDLEPFLVPAEQIKIRSLTNKLPALDFINLKLKAKEKDTSILLDAHRDKKIPGQVIYLANVIEELHTLETWEGNLDIRLAKDMFEQGQDAAMFVQSNGTIVGYNRNLPKSCLDKIRLEANFLDYLTPDSRIELDNALHKDFDDPSLKDPISIKFKGNEKIELSGFIKPLKSNIMMLHFLKTSDQENLQLQLLQSQKLHAMGELAGGIAHDFNNLLTAMIGFCDLLLMRHSPGDQSFTDIMQIKQNANRAANLVRQLLAFSRQQTLQPFKIDVTDNLAELKVLLQRLIGTNNELNIVHGRDLGYVMVDQGQLEQVIINLVVNARDAMPHGGEIRIITSTQIFTRPYQHKTCIVPKGSYVVIEVSDTGTGIDPENLPRIFDPFFSTKEVGMGTGLGLSTVYGILTQMEGYINVDTKFGEGTTFRIYLPQHQLNENEKIQQALPESSPKDLTGNAVILLVEDEVAVRKFGARTLLEKGYEIIEAQNGREAYEYLKSASARGDNIDLLVTDVVMPEMDGPELVEKTKDLLPDLKVIFMSGYAESTFRHRLSKEMDIHFLSKPFDLKDLAQKVKEITKDITPKSKKTSKAVFNYRAQSEG